APRGLGATPEADSIVRGHFSGDGVSGDLRLRVSRVGADVSPAHLRVVTGASRTHAGRSHAALRMRGHVSWRNLVRPLAAARHSGSSPARCRAQRRGNISLLSPGGDHRQCGGDHNAACGSDFFPGYAYRLLVCRRATDLPQPGAWAGVRAFSLYAEHRRPDAGAAAAWSAERLLLSQRKEDWRIDGHHHWRGFPVDAA